MLYIIILWFIYFLNFYIFTFCPWSPFTYFIIWNLYLLSSLIYFTCFLHPLNPFSFCSQGGRRLFKGAFIMIKNFSNLLRSENFNCSLENLALHMAFLKSSCSTVTPVSNNEFSKPFVKPGSAIKNRVILLLRLLTNKSDEKPLFLWWFQSSLSCCSSFKLSQDSSEEARLVFSWIKTWRPKRAHDGLGVTWLAGGWPGPWGSVLTARPVFSVFCPLLPQPPLRLRAKKELLF